MFVLKTSRDSKLVASGFHLYLIDEDEQKVFIFKVFRSKFECFVIHVR